MRTKQHWNECNTKQSYHAAQNLAFQLRETAKSKGFDPHGIKVITKEFTNESGYHADSIVSWEEGPLGWAYMMEYSPVPGVHIEPKHNVVTFYDI